MVWTYAKQLLDRLSVKAITQRFDKRRLQQEIDTHRLFLLLGFHRKHGAGTSSEQLSAELSAAAEALTHEERAAAVQEHLLAQVQRISAGLDARLTQAGDSTPAAAGLQQLAQELAQRRAATAAAQQSAAAPREQRRRGGLAAATGGGAGATSRAGPADAAPLPNREAAAEAAPSTRRLSLQEVSQCLQEELGHSLELRPSLQNGGQAGTGLWLRGSAPLGSVVALYPGPVYPPTAYRKIPGYPKVDRGNDCLIARLDGAVIDAKPWGRGGEQPGADAAEQQQPAAPQTAWRRQLELRHPLALAHFANHPSPGAEPNVVVAAFDWRPPSQGTESAALRAYIPNAGVSADSDFVGVRDPAETVAGLALVATRPLSDEELLLNYRLSTHVARPDWYTPVDEEEDRRRWA